MKSTLRRVLRIARKESRPGLFESLKLISGAIIGAIAADVANLYIVAGLIFVVPVTLGVALTVIITTGKRRSRPSDVIGFEDWLLGLTTGFYFGVTYLLTKVAITDPSAWPLVAFLDLFFAAVTFVGVVEKRTVKRVLESPDGDGSESRHLAEIWHYVRRHWRRGLLLTLLLASILSIFPFYPFSQCSGCQRNPNHLIPTIFVNLAFFSGNLTVVNTANATLFAITNLAVTVGPITGGLFLDGRTVPLELSFSYALKNFPYIGKVIATITTPEKVYPNSTGPSLVSPLTLWTNNTKTLGTSNSQAVFSSANPAYASLAIQDAFTSSDLWSTEIFIFITAHPAVQAWQFIVATDPITAVDGSQSSPSPPAFEHLSALGYAENVYYWTANGDFGGFTVSLIRPIWVELRPLYLSFLTVILGFYVGTYKYEKWKKGRHEHLSENECFERTRPYI